MERLPRHSAARDLVDALIWVANPPASSRRLFHASSTPNACATWNWPVCAATS
ncbi:hypothetical protein NKH77_18820 [Streptomyces sp. M19]